MSESDIFLTYFMPENINQLVLSRVPASLVVSSLLRAGVSG